jgi:hypothetical protein
MTEPLTLHLKNKGLVICHIIWAILLTIPFVIVMMFPDQMVDNLFDWLLFDLPEMNDPLSVVFWIILGVVNVLIVVAVMAVVLVFRLIAIPVMILTCIPSVVGAIGEMLNKRWGMKWMLVSGLFSLLLIPLGTALGVWTIVKYRRMNKIVSPRRIKESQPI